MYLGQVLADLLLVSLFTWAVVEAIHHGSVFAELRAYLEARGGRLNELISCPFCLSHWVACAGTVLLLFAFHKTNAAYCILVWFGSVRLSNVMNDLTGSFKRLSGDDEFDIKEDFLGRENCEGVGSEGSMQDDAGADASDDSPEDPVPPA